MTRMLTLRVPDFQSDWLLDRADVFDGDLSAATREAITAAIGLSEIIGASDPRQAFDEYLKRSEEEGARDRYADESGSTPPE
jgi:hypothetical protein